MESRAKQPDAVDHRYDPGLVTGCAREGRAREPWQDASCKSWIDDGCSWPVCP